MRRRSRTSSRRRRSSHAGCATTWQRPWDGQPSRTGESDVTLSDETIRLVRASGALLPVGASAPVLAFYARLFALAPEVRPLFPTDLDQQVRKLADMLAWIIA